MSDHAQRLVLLCDPNADARTFYGVMLRHFGLTVIETDNPSDALAIACREPVTAVVTELMTMPDGTSLLRALRNTDGGWVLPLFLITNVTAMAPLTDAFACGAAVRIKPLSPSQLAALVLAG